MAASVVVGLPVVSRSGSPAGARTGSGSGRRGESTSPAGLGPGPDRDASGGLPEPGQVVQQPVDQHRSVAAQLGWAASSWRLPQTMLVTSGRQAGQLASRLSIRTAVTGLAHRAVVVLTGGGETSSSTASNGSTMSANRPRSKPMRAS
jgi:hypothetical protein